MFVLLAYITIRQKRQRAWAALWAAVSHQKLPDDMPGDWLEKWGEESPVKLPGSMRDDPEDYPPIERADEIAGKNRRTTDELLERVLSHIGR